MYIAIVKLSKDMYTVRIETSKTKHKAAVDVYDMPDGKDLGLLNSFGTIIKLADKFGIDISATNGNKRRLEKFLYYTTVAMKNGNRRVFKQDTIICKIECTAATFDTYKNMIADSMYCLLQRDFTPDENCDLSTQLYKAEQPNSLVQLCTLMLHFTVANTILFPAVAHYLLAGFVSGCFGLNFIDDSSQGGDKKLVRFITRNMSDVVPKKVGDVYMLELTKKSSEIMSSATRLIPNGNAVGINTPIDILIKLGIVKKTRCTGATDTLWNMIKCGTIKLNTVIDLMDDRYKSIIIKNNLPIYLYRETLDLYDVDCTKLSRSLELDAKAMLCIDYTVSMYASDCAEIALLLNHAIVKRPDGGPVVFADIKDGDVVCASLVDSGLNTIVTLTLKKIRGVFIDINLISKLPIVVKCSASEYKFYNEVELISGAVEQDKFYYEISAIVRPPATFLNMSEAEYIRMGYVVEKITKGLRPIDVDPIAIKILDLLRVLY